MINWKRVPILAVSFLLLVTNQRATANFPSIRPVPCTNDVTGESGICTFNWSCVNVAHGVHIGPCVDRFFVGTCCKVPEKTKQNDGKVQTAKKNGQIPSYTPFLHPLAAKTETEKIKTIDRRDNVTLNPIDRDDSLFPLDIQSSKPQIVYDYKSRPSQESFSKNSQTVHNKKPLISAEFLHKLFFSANTTVKNVFNINQSSSATPSYSPNPITDNPVSETRGTTSGHRFQNKPVLDDSHNGRLPAGLDQSHDLRRPVAIHSTHDLQQPVKINDQHHVRQPVTINDQHHVRQPITINDQHHVRQPITINDQHHVRQPVTINDQHHVRQPVKINDQHHVRQPVEINDQHRLHKPVPLSEEHDLRWPVLEEDSHDQRLPVVNLYEWSGVWYLNNHQKPNGSNDFYSLTTHPFIPSVSHTTTVSTEPSQSFEQTTEKGFEETTSTSTASSTSTTFDDGDKFSTASSSSTTFHDGDKFSTASSSSTSFDDGDSFNHTSSNFTLFIRPTSLPPPSEATPLVEDTKPESIDGSISQNLSQVCGRSRGGGTTARIVGGRKSHYLRWPWMISLRRYEDKSYKHKCGATLLNEFWAITAAHCVDGKLPLDLMLRLGEYNFRRSDELHPHVERRVHVMVLHPQFDHITYENDLALLRFNEPVKLQANIVPVCLPDSMDDITGRIAVVTGWGRLSEAGELPASLHEVRMPILSNEECEQMYYEAGYAENIRDVFVCAGLSSGGLDACEGDSGGPMVVRGNEGQWTLVGLISWGMGCAAPKQPGVYTRISQFTDWIEGIISH